MRSIPIFLLLYAGLLCAPVSADPLGRLFTTPEQRQLIDEERARLGQTVDVEVPEISLEVDDSEEAAPQAARFPITLRGLVRRSSGTNTAWINDGNTNEINPATDFVRVTPGAIDSKGVQVKVPTRPAPVDLKVGQTYQPDLEQVIDIAGENTAAPQSLSPR